MWTLSVARTRVQRRAGAIRGALVVLERPPAEASAEDPRTEVELVYRRDPKQTGAQFRALLLGAGTVEAPEGEIGAWLAELNRGADQKEPLT